MSCNLNSFNIAKLFTKFDQAYYTRIYAPLPINHFNYQLIGYINYQSLQILRNHFSSSFYFYANNLYLQNYYNNAQAISNLFDEILHEFELIKLLSRRNEYIAVKNNNNEILFKVDRSLVPIFGFKSHGIHLNAYFTENNQKYMWITRRAIHKNDGGKLDNLVAGAIPYNLTPVDTLFKEAYEEAGIPKNMLLNALYLGGLSYKIEKYSGLRHDFVHIFNVELPATFIPKSIDDEVAEFIKVPFNKLSSLVIDSFSEFKYNSGLVIIYFLHIHKMLKDEDSKIFIDLFTKLTA